MPKVFLNSRCFSTCEIIMSNPEAMLVQLINSINKLSSLVQNVNDAIAKLSAQISQLESKMTDTQVSQVSTKFEGIPDLKSMIANIGAKIDDLGSTSNFAQPKVESRPSSQIIQPSEVKTSKKKEKEKEKEYVSPAIAEEAREVSTSPSASADAAFTAVSSKFKHITQMIKPTSSCGNITKMLEELRDEVETQVGMSPMLYELNSWVQRVSKMPESDILLPEVHSELIKKLDDWLERVTKAIHLKYSNE
jgi:chromosome segregation ATPase